MKRKKTESNPNSLPSDNLLTRRQALSTTAKLGIGAGVVIVAGGAAAYYATQQGGQPGPTQTQTTQPTTSQAAPITLNFMTAAHEDFWYDQESYKPLATYMKNNPNIKINPVVYSFFDVEAKMASAFTAGVYAWDVTYVWGGLLEEFAQYLTPLTDLGWNKSEIGTDLIPWIQNAIFWKDQYYGYPRMNEVFLLNANKDFMDKKGIKDMPKTYEELLDLCEMVHDPANGVYAFGAGLKAGYLIPVYLCFLHGNGGYLFKDDSQQTVVPDSKESIRAVEDMVNIFKKFMNPGAIQWIADVQTSTEFLQGHHVFDLWYPSHNWVVTQPESAVKSVYCDVWPGKKGVVESGSEIAAEGYGIPKTAKYPQQALDFVRYVGTAENQVQCYITGGWTPNAQAPLPSFFSNYRDPRMISWPFAYTVKAHLKQEMYNCSRYERPAYPEIVNAIEAEVSNALAGIKTPSQAMTDAREACDGIVAREYSKYGGGYFEPWKVVQQDSVQSTLKDLLKNFENVPNYYTGK